MNIYQHTPEQVESFVRSQSPFLDERIKATYEPDLSLASISRNSNQGGRKSIYNLHLSDGTAVVLKLYSKEGAQREVEGMNYADLSKLPNPGLFDYDLTNSNPLQNAFLLMGYVDITPVKEMFQGSYEVQKWGKEFRVDQDVLRDHIKEASGVCLQLHQISATKNSMYSSEAMKQLFEKYQSMIRQRIDQSSQEELITGLEGLFRYYEENQVAFQESPEYHLHGDLDPSNLPHTRNGIVLIDWENYHKGDCAEDVAYFAERNLWISEDVEEQIGQICEGYSKKDSTFGTRLGFHLPLSKLWHVVVKGIPKEVFLEARHPNPF